MRYTIIIIALLALLPMAAAAGVLDISGISDAGLTTGSSFEFNNATFKVTSIEKVYFSQGDGQMIQKRIFVENSGRNIGLEKQIKEIEKSMEENRNYSLFLESVLNRTLNSSEKLSSRLSSLAAETGILKSESQNASSELQQALISRSALEKELEGRFLLNRSHSSLLLIIFTVLVIAVLVIEAKAYFRKE